MSENTHEDPDATSVTGTPATEVEESDPNADSAEGLDGDMGVSSERLGRVRGVEVEVTYGSAPTHPEEQQVGETPPEQSAYDGRPEVNPDSPGAHPSDPASNPRHGV